MLPIRFSFANVGDVNLHHGHADGPDAVGDGDGGVGVCPRVHDHAVVGIVSRLQRVNQYPFMVGLAVIQLDFGEFILERLVISIKRDMAVNSGLAAA